MAASRPLWRRCVEAVDKVAAPVLEGAVQTDAFSSGVSALVRNRNAIRRRTERLSRQVLHHLNLPAASDVNRLLAQIAAVENGVRTLDMHLEDRLATTESRTLPHRRRPHGASGAKRVPDTSASRAK
jgi:hypothetical protein